MEAWATMCTTDESRRRLATIRGGERGAATTTSGGLLLRVDGEHSTAKRLTSRRARSRPPRRRPRGSRGGMVGTMYRQQRSARLVRAKRRAKTPTSVALKTLARGGEGREADLLLAWPLVRGCSCPLQHEVDDSTCARRCRPDLGGNVQVLLRRRRGDVQTCLARCANRVVASSPTRASPPSHRRMPCSASPAGHRASTGRPLERRQRGAMHLPGVAQRTWRDRPSIGLWIAGPTAGSS